MVLTVAHYLFVEKHYFRIKPKMGPTVKALLAKAGSPAYRNLRINLGCSLL